MVLLCFLRLTLVVSVLCCSVDRNIPFSSAILRPPGNCLQVTDGEFQVHALNELEYINGEIWANIWLTDCIARIDPATGAVKCAVLTCA